MHARTCNECLDMLRYDVHLVTSVGFHISMCCFACFLFFSGKIQSVLAYLSSSGLLNMQLEWNGRVGFTQSNCSGSGGQGNLEELKESRRNGTSLGSERFLLASCQKEVPQHSTALQKLYHALVGGLHARNAALKTDSF